MVQKRKLNWGGQKFWALTPPLPPTILTMRYAVGSSRFTVIPALCAKYLPLRPSPPPYPIPFVPNVLCHQLKRDLIWF